MPEAAPAATLPKSRPAGRLLRIASATLTLTTVGASTGWYLAAHDGRGVPRECYVLEGPSAIRFDAVHGNDTHRATFAVAESDTRVMLGYWEQVEDGLHTLEGYGSRLTYTLSSPLGDRTVVDAAGEPIPTC